MAPVPTNEGMTARVEAALREILDARQMPLYKMMSYHLGWEDERGERQHTVPMERPHGVACLVACYASDGDPGVAIPAAASVELIESFCQIHDDVQGGNPKRGNRDAVWWVWGPAQAINAGDGMHALARLAIFRIQHQGVPPARTFQAVQLLDEASLAVCEGRFQDLEAQETLGFTVEAYLEMAASKTGALYSCAMKLGALAAEADERVVEALGVCGSKLGVAVQVRDDLEQMWGSGWEEEAPSPEVLNKKKLLPVVYAMEKATISEKRRMGDIYFKRVLEPADVVLLRALLEELGAREYCEELVRECVADAMSALGVHGISADGKDALKGYVKSLVAL